MTHGLGYFFMTTFLEKIDKPLMKVWLLLCCRFRGSLLLILDNSV